MGAKHPSEFVFDMPRVCALMHKLKITFVYNSTISSGTCPKIKFESLSLHPCLDCFFVYSISVPTHHRSLCIKMLLKLCNQSLDDLNSSFSKSEVVIPAFPCSTGPYRCNSIFSPSLPVKYSCIYIFVPYTSSAFFETGRFVWKLVMIENFGNLSHFNTWILLCLVTHCNPLSQ